MSTGHQFCITSISDLTSTVTLEAFGPMVTIICFRPLWIFAGGCQRNVGLKSGRFTKKGYIIAKALKTPLYDDENYRQSLSSNTLCIRSVGRKNRKLNLLYISLLKKN
jgi:hypothetical protein